MNTQRPSVFDGLAAGSPADDPLDQRLLAEIAERLVAAPQTNRLQALLADFRTAGYESDVRAWLAPGQSSAPPPLPAEAIDRVATLGHVIDHAWLQQVAGRNGIDVATAGRRFATLVPRVIKTLTPRGDVPSQRALMIGVEALRRKAAR